MSYRRALILAEVMKSKKVKSKNRNYYPQAAGALSGDQRIHGQGGHQEVVFDVTLVSAVICMQV
jgi:hypothetical protein